LIKVKGEKVMSKVYENGDPIDVDKLIQAVRDTAAENPDFVYTQHPEGSITCLYTLEDGTPDCIIGRAMARIGQPLPPQNPAGGNECTLLNNGVCTWGRYEEDPLYGDRNKLNWLATVQGNQDGGFTWEYAVQEADRQYPLS
jgi:hypothetical protein